MFVPLAPEQNFRLHFPELSHFETTKDLEKSPVYRNLQPGNEEVPAQAFQEGSAILLGQGREAIEVAAWAK